MSSIQSSNSGRIRREEKAEVLRTKSQPLTDQERAGLSLEMAFCQRSTLQIWTAAWKGKYKCGGTYSVSEQLESTNMLTVRNESAPHEHVPFSKGRNISFTCSFSKDSLSTYWGRAPSLPLLSSHLCSANTEQVSRPHWALGIQIRRRAELTGFTLLEGAAAPHEKYRKDSLEE